MHVPDHVAFRREDLCHGQDKGVEPTVADQRKRRQEARQVHAAADLLQQGRDLLFLLDGLDKQPLYSSILHQNPSEKKAELARIGTFLRYFPKVWGFPSSCTYERFEVYWEQNT